MFVVTLEGTTHSGLPPKGSQSLDNNRPAVKKSKLRVAFVGHTAQPSGGELALVELIRHLDKARVEPVVVLFSSGPLCEMLQGIADVHILPLSSGVLTTRKDSLGFCAMFRRGGLASVLSSVWRLRNLLRWLDVDIVHTNSLKADVLAGIAARLCSLPVLWHVRDRIAPDYLPRPAAVAFRFLAGIIPSYIVANSASTLESLGSRAGSRSVFRASEASVVHDGVNLSDFEAFRIPSPCQRLTVGLVGRISPWKGQDIFLRAAVRVRQRFPDVHFLIIGSSLFGEKQFEHSVRSLCDELDLTDHVEFTGFVKNVRQRIAQLDILVHASTLPEPFGQVIIEAMAAGKPVIATNGGGVPEIVIDGMTGILVPMRDAERMAQGISLLIADPRLRAEMGTRGRERVRQAFTIQQTAKKMQQIYEAIVAFHPRCGGRVDATAYDPEVTDSGAMDKHSETLADFQEYLGTYREGVIRAGEFQQQA